MTISISIDRILDSIYARAALEASIHGTGNPALLDRSDSKALRRVTIDCLAELVASLSHIVSSGDIASLGNDTEIITLETTLGHGDMLAPTFRMNLETATVCAVLAHAYAGTPGRGEWYAELSRMSFVPFPPSIRRAV